MHLRHLHIQETLLGIRKRNRERVQRIRWRGAAGESAGADRTVLQVQPALTSASRHVASSGDRRVLLHGDLDLRERYISTNVRIAMMVQSDSHSFG
uniref:Uncharacterized protein n=1 Tax=Steinernema glaseri TaxID=37863 RepID=A0A1I7Z237_9BILA